MKNKHIKNNKRTLIRFFIFLSSILLYRVTERFLPETWWSMLIEIVLGGTAIYIAVQLLRTNIPKDEKENN